MAQAKKARDLLGLPSDSEEIEEGNALTKYLDRLESEWTLWIIIALFWPIALFGIRAGYIFSSLLIALGLIGTFMYGWPVYIFIGLVTGGVAVAAKHSSADIASYPKALKITLKTLTLAFLFYVLFPIDSLIAQSQIQEEAASIAEVRINPSGEGDIIEIYVDGESYASSSGIYSSPVSFLKFANEYKPVAIKTIEVSKGGFGIPFIKSTPELFRFIFKEGDPLEKPFAYFIADYSVDVGINVSLAYDNEITVGGTATYLGTNDYKSDAQDGTKVKILYSQDSANWTEVGSFVTTDGGGATRIQSPGPGKLKLAVDPLEGLPSGESEVAEVVLEGP
jgi:hypothetical protein